MTTSEPGGAAVPTERTRRPHPVARLLRALVSPDSYGSVLVLILITYVLSVSLNEPWQRSVVLFLQIGTVWLALRVSHARRVVLAFAGAVLALAGAIAVGNLVGMEGDAAAAVVFFTSSLLYFIAPLSILRSLVTQEQVDQETVLGAVDAYLFVGMFFAYVYLALGVLQAPFFEGGAEGTPGQALFFSFTTLTTTGYGNLVPAANPGQSFAVMEMLIGQLFLVTAVAKVINAWRPTRWRAGQGGTEPAAGRPASDGEAP